MSDISKLKFTNSSAGRPILVSNTATPGTAIHTVTTNSSRFEEIWLYAQNNHTANVTLTVEFGSNTNASQVQSAIPFRTGLYLIIPGIPLQGDGTPPTVRAFTNVANTVSISGWVNQLG